MKCVSSPHRVWAGCLLALSFLVVLPAGATDISVGLNDLSGNVKYSSSGGLTTSGIPDSGNVLVSGLSFDVPPLDNAVFDNIVNGSYPVQATFEFTGAVNNQSATLTTTNTFTDPSELGTFFGVNTNPNRVLALGTGILTGAYSGTFSDIFFNLTDKSFADGQLSGATGNLVATANGTPNGSAEFTFTGGTGSATLDQVSDVPEPAYIGLIGLALLGLGSFWRRKQRAPYS